MKRTLLIFLLAVALIFSCKQKIEKADIKEESGDTLIETSTQSEYKEYGSDLGPVFSPDGSEIAFYSYLNSDPSVGRIFISNKQGTEFRLLTENDTIGMHTEPKWSPDGSKIGYTSFLEKGARIMAINTNGEELKELVSVSENGYHMFSCWDNQGEGYYFFHWPEGGFTPDAYYAKESDVVQLTSDGISCRPQLARSGNLYVSKIVDLENNIFEKYRVDPKTKEAVKVPEIDGFDLSGNHFLINREQEEGTTIILEDLHGNDLRALGIVSHKGIMFTTLDPEEKYVAYNTSFDDGAEIHLLEVETGKISKITSNE